MADVSVRPALVDDALAIGALHSAAMRRSIEAALGTPLPPADFNTAAFAQQWGAAIAHPPSAKHRVVVALADQEVVGFAAVAPIPHDDGAAGASPGSTSVVIPAEIVALDVAAAHLRQGHASRLLAAVADMLRATGAPAVRTWCVLGDEARTRFLHSAGFAPLGVRRTYDVGTATITENAWWVAF